MEYQRFDPTGCGFPKPRVPILPTLSRQSLGRGQSGLFSPLGSGAKTRFFTRGRYALTEAYRQSGVGDKGALLAPAYHCRTMLDPAIRLGAEVGLYALRPDLSPDMDSLATSLAACQHPVKALLVTHYFGFAQDLEPLAGFCGKYDIALIEDCAHALFIKSETNTIAKSGAMGKTGRFCVASPYKFFPSEDGGLLWTNGGDEFPADQKPTPTFAQELKGLLHSAQRARDQNRPPDVKMIDNEIQALAGKLALTGHDAREQDTQASKHYLAAEEHLTSLAWSRWVTRHTNVARLADRRRHNYQQWANAVADLPHCRALFPHLPDATVPYMFPLQIDHPEVHFFALKQLGVPVWRWDDMAMSNCRIASTNRLNLLHLPCHQELTAQQMSWMTTAVKQVMLQLSPWNQ